MQTRQRNIFLTIHTEGAILPPDLLQKIESGDRNLKGLAAEDYHLAGGERLNEAVSRSWNRLVGIWASFKPIHEQRSPSDANTTGTRERWLLPLFQELGYGRLIAAKAAEIDGKTYPISHHWQQTPIHLVGSGVDLDKRTSGIAGAARISPHGLLQEYLNRSEESLWGFVSNGLWLRILRDNKSLTRQAFVEFDLDGMMSGEVYSDFVLLWLLCHQSRVEADRPEGCWLEKWSKAAQDQGTRALEQLRKGVEESIKALGRGFLSHPAKKSLLEKLRLGILSGQDYYRQLLRLVYRFIFLFVAEDRGLLLDPGASPTAKERYSRFYSASRLRRLAQRRLGTRHGDLYQGMRLVMEKLESGCPDLGLPALGSFLFSGKALPDLEDCEIENADLLDAVRALVFITDGHSRHLVDYKNLRSEELGSVYEALLELHPVFNSDAGTFDLQIASGHERKTTGSYYTPESLVQCLLDSALDPVLAEATKKPNPEAAILKLKVCDPACGSGHFLIAAAHRIAKRLAAIRTGDGEPSPEQTRRALRDVIGHCIYGVDVNPMAVELCKVSLWMEALEPGKPLSFLEHRILCGNSLLGTTPALLANGIPDEAFKPIEGDDPKLTSAYRRQNKAERLGQGTLLYVAESTENHEQLMKSIEAIDAAPDETIEGIHNKERRLADAVSSYNYRKQKMLADAWCAAFVWTKTKEGLELITEATFQRLASDPGQVSKHVRDEIEELAEGYQFFHWHLAFPDVFRFPFGDEKPENQPAGWSGGFDVVLGNPPWDQIQLDAREFFGQRAPEISGARHTTARKKAVAQLSTSDPELLEEYRRAQRKVEGLQHFIHSSGRYPFTSFGRLNSAPLFAEFERWLVSCNGRIGIIVPTGIATDSFNQHFFRDLIESRVLIYLHDFENREGLFPAVDSRMKLCLLTLHGSSLPAQCKTDFVFFAHSTNHLKEEHRHFSLSPSEMALLNPNTQTCPIFRTAGDAVLALAIHRRVPVFVNEHKRTGNPWGFEGKLMFMMNTASHLFRTRTELEAEGWKLEGNVYLRGAETFLPLYEAKMSDFYDHRAAHVVLSATAAVRQGQPEQLSGQEHADPSVFPMPRVWVDRRAVDDSLGDKWSRNWLLGVRDITSSTNERSVIPTLIPRVAVGNSLQIFLVAAEHCVYLPCLAACLSSYILDFAARFKIGGTHLNFFIAQQLPVLPPSTYAETCSWSPLGEGASCSTTFDWILPRVLELTYTASDMEPFAKDYGYDGLPLRWDDGRRFLLRCELDAAFFHLYLPADMNSEWRMANGETPGQVAELKKHFPRPRRAVDYVLDTFHSVKRKDEEKFGEYRTKRVTLEIYDALAEAMRTGQPYKSRLDPPPALGWKPRDHPAMKAAISVLQTACKEINREAPFELRSPPSQSRLRFDES
jgi:hypothetical protein